MSDYDEFVESLAKLGEIEVSTMLAQGIWANRHKAFAEQWLQAKQSERTSTNQAAGLDIARKANAIAQSSLETARSAKNAAWVAAGVAIIAALFAAFTCISAKP